MAVGPSEKDLVKGVAAKMSKGRGPTGYYVENQNSRIGPYQNQAKAQARYNTESTVAGESGNTGKAPELTYVPKGTTPARQFKQLTRVSPRAPSGNGPNSRGYDYLTNQAVRRDTPAQRASQPRGYQGK